jgi:hypothetical protein
MGTKPPSASPELPRHERRRQLPTASAPLAKIRGERTSVAWDPHDSERWTPSDSVHTARLVAQFQSVTHPDVDARQLPSRESGEERRLWLGTTPRDDTMNRAPTASCVAATSARRKAPRASARSEGAWRLWLARSDGIEKSSTRPDHRERRIPNPRRQSCPGLPNDWR